MSEKPFILVTDKMPAVKSYGPVASSSPLLNVKTKSGKIVQGFYQLWDRDMNAPHIQAKKSEGVFHTPANEVIADVEAWQLL